MFKLISRLSALVLASFLLLGCSENSVPQEGSQFQRLPNDVSSYDVAPLTEVFSLSCGHCRKMENFIPQIESLTSQKVDKLHVTFNETAQIAAMIYYTAVMQLDATPDHAFMDELFAAVQMGEGSTNTERQAAIEKAFQTRDLVSPYQLNKEQQTTLFTYLEKAQHVSVAGEINSVPTFIVKGKYQVLTAGHDNIEAIAHTISYLLTQP